MYESCQDLLLVVPGALNIHHAIVGGTLIHSLDVAKIGLSIANTIKISDKSLVVAGALLHDIGKLRTYTLDGASIVMTDDGKLFEHLYMGCSMIESLGGTLVKSQEDARKLDLLMHIVLSHHGSLEMGSVVNTMSIEAVIVSTSDNLDALQYVITKASESTETFWTDKVYTMNNRPVINYRHTKATMLKFDELELPWSMLAAVELKLVSSYIIYARIYGFI